MADNDLMQRRLSRERGARKQAERLLEEKSRELYDANQKLRSLAESLEQKVEQRTSELEDERKVAVAAALAKSNFLAMMSHEIRTPMNGVLGTLALLDREQMDSEQTDLLDTAVGSAESLLDIINDILDFSKIEAGKLEFESIDFDLHELLANISGAMVTLTHEKGVTLTTQIDERVPRMVAGDPLRLRQLLINLIGNAIKFTERGGISIDVKPAGDRTIAFSVADTGCGISPENQTRIFNEFSQGDGSTTREFGGTGLGLAISSRLASLMGGKLQVRSKVGVGSTFWFTADLPTRSEMSQSTPEPKAHADELATDLRVLLVEDNPTNQKILSLYLKRMGVAYEIANNGDEAVRRITTASGDFNLVLMDAQMPIMDGYEATSKIRKLEASDSNNARIPIIALTANAMRGDREKCIAAGMDDYMTKPVRADALREMIRTWTSCTADEVA